MNIRIPSALKTIMEQYQPIENLHQYQPTENYGVMSTNRNWVTADGQHKLSMCPIPH